MDEVKGIFQSKAVWGGITALLAGIAGLFGYTVTPELQADIATQALGLVSAVGGALAIWGRIKASKKIGNA